MSFEATLDEEVDEDGEPGEREEERHDAVAEDQLVDRGSLGLGDGRIDQVLDKVSLPGDEGREVGGTHDGERAHARGENRHEERDREHPGDVPHQEEREQQGECAEEDQQRKVEPYGELLLDEVVGHRHRESDQPDDPGRDVESERVHPADPLHHHRDDEGDRDHDHAVGVPLPGQRERSERDAREDGPFHRAAFRTDERADRGDVLSGVAVIFDPTSTSDRLDGTDVRIDDNEDDESVKRKIVRIPEDRGVDVPAQEREDDRRDEPRPSARDLSADQVDREDAERGPERGLQVQEPGARHDGVPAEERGEDDPEDRVHPVEQRLSGVDRSDRELEERVVDQIRMVEDDVLHHPGVVVGVRAAGVGEERSPLGNDRIGPDGPEREGDPERGEKNRHRPAVTVPPSGRCRFHARPALRAGGARDLGGV